MVALDHPRERGEDNGDGVDGDLLVQGRLDGARDRWLSDLRTVPDSMAISSIAAARRCLDVLEAEILARHVTSGGDERHARRLLDRSGSGTAGDRRRRVGRARVVRQSDEVGAMWADGQLCSERVDLLANADRKTNNSASADPELLADLAAAGPDLARRTKDDWLAKRANERDLAHRDRRQRLARTAWRHTTDCGLPAVTVAGDAASINVYWQHVVAAADTEYKKDGGRHQREHKHPRTPEQRLFDAAMNIAAGKTTGAGRPAAVVTFTIDPADQRTARGEHIGHGPISNEAAERILSDAELWTLLVDPVGHPLWMGRSRRQPTKAQLLAVVTRDKSCVATGHHWKTSDIHHAIPWSSPAAGPTDIDNLTLLSKPAHRACHTDHTTWELSAETGKWRNRPATADEIAPNRPARE